MFVNWTLFVSNCSGHLIKLQFPVELRSSGPRLNTRNKVSPTNHPILIVIAVADDASWFLESLRVLSEDGDSAQNMTPDPICLGLDTEVYAQNSSLLRRRSGNQQFWA